MPEPVRTSEYKTRFVDYMPPRKEPGILYVSERFGLAIHLCACGCGSQAVMRLCNYGQVWHDGWSIAFNDGLVTFTPSILNRSCGAHYFIEQNRVRWA